GRGPPRSSRQRRRHSLGSPWWPRRVPARHRSGIAGRARVDPADRHLGDDQALSRSTARGRRPAPPRHICCPRSLFAATWSERQLVVIGGWCLPVGRQRPKLGAGGPSPRRSLSEPPAMTKRLVPMLFLLAACSTGATDDSPSSFSASFTGNTDMDG